MRAVPSLCHCCVFYSGVWEGGGKGGRERGRGEGRVAENWATSEVEVEWNSSGKIVLELSRTETEVNAVF